MDSWDAGTPIPPPVVAPPERPWPLQSTAITIRNESDQTVFLARGPLTVPPRALFSEVQLETRATLGEPVCVCLCDEWHLHGGCDQVACRARALAREPMPHQALSPGAERELAWAGDQTQYDGTGVCLRRVGYEDGAELDARFCWYATDPDTDPRARRRCIAVVFHYGDETLELIVPATMAPTLDEDASAGDEDASVAEEDAGVPSQSSTPGVP